MMGHLAQGFTSILVVTCTLGSIGAFEGNRDGWNIVEGCDEHGYGVRDAPVRIFDAFPFFQELDMLEIRLFELYPVVHRYACKCMSTNAQSHILFKNWKMLALRLFGLF